MSQAIYKYSRLKSACDTIHYQLSTINYSHTPSGVKIKKTKIPLKYYGKFFTPAIRNNNNPHKKNGNCCSCFLCGL
ncbi:MAG: hypothetical protein LBE12_10125 [Planctomycetaceae bacterium]|nr:hypothetical protein [Planctomycetaceae bacterium]